MVRVIMTQTENIQQMCEFQTQSISSLQCYQQGSIYMKGIGFRHNFNFTALKPKVFLN